MRLLAKTLMALVGLWLLFALWAYETKKPTEQLLKGGYFLSRYESTDNYGFYITDPNHGTVIPSDVEKINVLSHWIAGYVSDGGVLAMPRARTGFFVIDLDTGKITDGLTEQQLKERFPELSAMSFVSSQNWK